MMDVEGLVTSLGFENDCLVGWAYDPRDLSRRVIVEIRPDEGASILLRAETFIPALRERGIGDGCYGFVLHPGLNQHGARLAGRYSLLVANGTRILATVDVPTNPRTGEHGHAGGSVIWRGGLRLTGTLPRTDARRPELDVFHGAQRLECWSRFLPPAHDGPTGAVQFDLFLPPTLADGRLNEIRVLDKAGRELDGSPVWVVAHPGGFRALIGQHASARPGAARLRDRSIDFLDALVPGALPFEAYPDWIEAFDPPTTFPKRLTRIGIAIIGRDASDVTLASLRSQAGGVHVRAGIVDCLDQAHPCFAAEDWRDLATRMGEGEGVDALLVVRSGSILKPHACAAVLAAFEADGAHPARLCLADHELFTRHGDTAPLFMPAFDYERLLTQGYAEGVFAAHPSLLTPMSDGPLSTYDLLLAAVGALGPAARQTVVHVPWVVASVPQLAPEAAVGLLSTAVSVHLRREGMTAALNARTGHSLPALAIKRDPPAGEVDILIPTRDRLDLLKPCVETLLTRTKNPPLRVTIIDNGSTAPETHVFLRALEKHGLARIIRDEGEFNYARLNNEAVRQSSSAFICLLNNDVEIIDDDWLSAMLGHLARPDVGAVGAKLLWPNRMVQHGGVVLGTNFAASHAHDRSLDGDPGYADGLLVAREAGALTAACLLMRRSDFLSVGGFDERAFPVTFNDVDLCLKLRAAGLALVWTPEAVLLHKESASRGSDRKSPDKIARSDKELAELRRRWGAALVEDPYYNPSLNRDAHPYTGFGFPPRGLAARRNEPPVMRSIWGAPSPRSGT